MSHFTTMATRFTEKRHLLQALSDLGIRYEEGAGLQISGYEGKRTDCEVRIETDVEGYDIGLRRNGDSYEVVADWYGLDDFDRRGFMAALTQRYAYCAVKDQLGAQLAVVEEKQEADGTIRVLLRGMV